MANIGLPNVQVRKTSAEKEMSSRNLRRLEKKEKLKSKVKEQSKNGKPKKA